MIWNIDSRRNALDSAVRIFGNRYELVDFKLRQVFKARVMMVTLKSVIGFNHCDQRNHVENNKMTCERCLRYNQVED